MNQRPGTILLRILVVVLTALLGAAVADRVMGFSQKHYVAAVTLQVKDGIGEAAAPAEEKPVNPEAILRAITSDAVLNPVMKALGLPDAAAAELRKTITVRAIRNTLLVQISVRAGEPKAAADLANALAEEYQRTRIEARQKTIDDELLALQVEVDRKHQEVVKLRTDLAALRLEAGITDLYPDSMEETPSLPEAILELRKKIAALRVKIEQLSALTDAQVIEEISRNTDFGKSLDPTLTLLSASRLGVLDEITKSNAAGIGPDHPTMKSHFAKLAVLDKQLPCLIPTLRLRLETELKTSETRLQAAEAMTAGSQPKAGQVEMYHEVKKKYLEEKQLWGAMVMKRARADIDRAMPRNPAIIWERAEPPAAPDSKPVVMLFLGALLGLFVGVGLAFLPRPGITAGVVLVLLGVASFPRWAASVLISSL